MQADVGAVEKPPAGGDWMRPPPYQIQSESAGGNQHKMTKSRERHFMTASTIYRQKLGVCSKRQIAENTPNLNDNALGAVAGRPVDEDAPGKQLREMLLMSATIWTRLNDKGADVLAIVDVIQPVTAALKLSSDQITDLIAFTARILRTKERQMQRPSSGQMRMTVGR